MLSAAKFPASAAYDDAPLSSWVVRLALVYLSPEWSFCFFLRMGKYIRKWGSVILKVNK